MYFIVIEDKIRDKISPKWQGLAGEFNQLSESEAASASSLNVSAVSKKKNNGKQKKAMLWESDFQTRAQIILRRPILHCSKRVLPWNHAAELSPSLFLFCGSTLLFSLLICSLLTTTKTLSLFMQTNINGKGERNWNLDLKKNWQFHCKQ